ncbi:MAG: hypothetical protein IPK94_08245 [Saprospiraceae bacterium]|nr:hypothetical protein [Saprospiraceae bacterium]
MESYYAADLHNDVPVLTGWVTGMGRFRRKYADPASGTSNNRLKKNYPQQAAQLLKLFPPTMLPWLRHLTVKMRRLGFGAVPAITWAQYNRSPVYV